MSLIKPFTLEDLNNGDGHKMKFGLEFYSVIS